MNGKRVGLYLRVSTGEQTIETQRIGLVAVCEARGWGIVEEFEDNGISGAKGREKRPGFDRLLRAATTRKIDVVAAWSVDRLGRSLQDLVSFLAELSAVGCDLYLERQAVDTTTPAGRALFQMLGSSLSSSDPSSRNGSRPGWSGLASTGPRAESQSVSRRSPRPRSRQSEPSWPAEPASSRPRGCVGPVLVRCNGSN